MRVLFFAHLIDLAGCAETELSPAAPLTESEFWSLLLSKFPALAPHQSSVRLARNCEYTAPNTAFHAGDEIALIPPVSGG